MMNEHPLRSKELGRVHCDAANRMTAEERIGAKLVGTLDLVRGYYTVYYWLAKRSA